MFDWQDQRDHALERAAEMQRALGNDGYVGVATYPSGRMFPHAIFVWTRRKSWGEGWVERTHWNLVHVRHDPNFKARCHACGQELQ